MKSREILKYINDALIKKFWARVDKSGDCWLWKNKVDNRGYGRFYIKRGTLSSVEASRVSWIIANRIELNKSQFVCHKCDNPPCVRPDHLFLGAAKENAEDRASKGRNRNQNGELNDRSILKSEDVIEIRRIFSEKEMKIREIADKYKVSFYTIRNIVYMQSWKHI